MPQNNSGVISALPSVDFACNVCGPDSLFPQAMHRGDQGANSVFHGLLENKLGSATDTSTNNSRAVFTTSDYTGSNPFSLTVQASTTAGNHDRTVIYPTYVEARQYKVKDSSGSFPTTLTDAGLTLVGGTALSGGSLAWDGGGNSGRSAELKWNASNSLTVSNSGTVIVGNLSATSFTTIHGSTVEGDLTVKGNTTLGDASSDTMSCVATPNFAEVASFDKGITIDGVTDSIGIKMNGNAISTTDGNIDAGSGTVIAGTATLTNATIATTPTTGTMAVRYSDVNINSGASKLDGFKQPKIVVTNGFITAITEGDLADATNHGAYHHSTQETSDSPATGTGQAGAISAVHVGAVSRSAPVLRSSGANGIMITNRTGGNYKYETFEDHDNGKYTDSLFKVITSGNPETKGPPGQLIFRKKA